MGAIFTIEGNGEVLQISQKIERKYGDKALRIGEVGPGCKAPVLLPSPKGPEADLYIWGYRTPKSLVFNARAETAAEKPMFREGVMSRRCVIPSTGFFEWESAKRQYLFTMPDTEMLYMAGIYAIRGGIPCYCILTTEANVSMREVHHRMPLVLEQRQAEAWMNDSAAAGELLRMTPPMLERRPTDGQIDLWTL